MRKALFHLDDIAHLSEAEQQAAIQQQRKDMNVKPWELCLLEVDDGPSPWPDHTAGACSWVAAQRFREKLRRKD